MARATSGLGQFRGKVGSVVFRVNQGKQIASAYQPAVRNPKSNLQTAQRNKMYLASQLSKLVPREDIIGLAPRGTARDRRSMFIRNVLDSAVSTLDGELFNTSLSTGKVLFSNGNMMEGIGAGAINSESNTIPITIDTNVIDEDTYNRLAIKVIQIDVVNSIYESYKSAWLDLPEYSTASSGTITINVGFTRVDEEYSAVTLWMVPVLLNDSVRYSREKKTLVQFDKDDVGFVIQGEYAISNAVYEWKKSQLLGYVAGDVPVVPPSVGGGDEVVNPDGPIFPNLG